MFSFFRNIRRKLSDNNQFVKYSRYAIGEIVLVVIGIVIALQLNGLKERREKESIRTYYTAALLVDLEQDSITIDELLASSQKKLDLLNNQASRIFNPGSTIDTLVKIARFEFDFTFNSIQYNDNSFKTIISTGYADLFNKDIIKILMELDEFHRDEINDSRPNSETYRTQLATYYRSYSPNYGQGHNNLIDSILWTDINEKDFVGKFRAMFFFKIFMTNQFIDHLIVLKEKTHEAMTFMRQ